MAGVRQVGVRQVGARVEELLGTLRSGGNGAAAPAAEELVRILLGLYGDGLGHIMAALHESGDGGAAVLDRLLADPLVESLLVLHDLHPLDVDARIQRALDGVRPYLGSHAGGVEYLGVTDDGVAHLRLEGSCHGCPSSTLTVRLAIQGAIEGAAPEVTDVVVEGVSEPAGQQALLQIGSGPPGRPGAVPAGVPGAGPGTPAWASEPAWVTLPDMGPPSGRPLATVAGGLPVLVCSVRGTLYAYRDACAACGSSLAQATLAGERLDCAGCGAAYDVRSAGRGLDDHTAHLDPLPLLADSQGVRVAIPASQQAVRS
jgi:Fe-S cluster biogenesis protein NfuA/nitrite reductase/ring-hydroxylating ferredoxin subunit